MQAQTCLEGESRRYRLGRGDGADALFRSDLTKRGTLRPSIYSLFPKGYFVTELLREIPDFLDHNDGPTLFRSTLKNMKDTLSLYLFLVSKRLFCDRFFPKNSGILPLVFAGPARNSIFRETIVAAVWPRHVDTVKQWPSLV